MSTITLVSGLPVQVNVEEIVVVAPGAMVDGETALVLVKDGDWTVPLGNTNRVMLCARLAAIVVAVHLYGFIGRRGRIRSSPARAQVQPLPAEDPQNVGLRGGAVDVALRAPVDSVMPVCVPV